MDIDGNKMIKILKGLVDDERNVAKSIPATKEQIAQMRELDSLQKQSNEICAKKDALRNAFWSGVKMSLDDYTSELHYNDETDEIEIYEEPVSKKKSVKSPYIQKGRS